MKTIPVLANDVARCQPQNCKVKESCLRFLSPTKDLERQVFLMIDNKGNDCDNYWKFDSEISRR